MNEDGGIEEVTEKSERGRQSREKQKHGRESGMGGGDGGK